MSPNSISRTAANGSSPAGVFEAGCYVTTLLSIAAQGSGGAPPPKPLLIASPAPSDGGDFPVLLLIHGYLLYNSFYSQLISHIASHGYIVIAPQPRISTNKRRRPFRFEAAWITHPNFEGFMAESWDHTAPVHGALDNLKGKLQKWNKEIFGDIFKRKNDLHNRLEKAQAKHHTCPSANTIKEVEKIQEELQLTLDQEELLWYQKSRETWLLDGDRNTSFFHATTVIRRQKNRVLALRRDDGQWTEDSIEMENMAVSFFKHLYQADPNVSNTVFCVQHAFPTLSCEEWNQLDKEVTAEEILQAIKQMGPLKAPGPDGFQPIFYQRFWSIVGKSVIDFVSDFFANSKFQHGINDTLITLIAKVNKPEFIKDFRPISLCNVLYKIITKILTNRMQSIMPKLISPVQGGFIPGRVIVDNISLAQEVVHSVQRKKGKKGWMIIKLDLEKAYDRLSWDFILDTLKDAGFSTKWRSWIHECLHSTTMSILWNGETTERFSPTRGVRQGDPISPFLFALCIERLSQLITLSVEQGTWTPIKLTRGSHPISHLLFADDILLFAEATTTNCDVILNCLNSFCAVSGQKISFEKSKIFFSPNTPGNIKHEILKHCRFEETNNLGKYLGVPLIHNRCSKEVFTPLLEKFQSKLQSWKRNFLSFAGRITLARSVLASLPIYTMASIILPNAICEDIDKIIRNFIWGSTANRRRIHLVRWEDVCLPKHQGGLGLRRMRDVNLALISKLSWRYLTDLNSWWAVFFRRKYEGSNSSLPASCVWNSIRIGLNKVIMQGIRWNLFNGNSIDFWDDMWVGDVRLRELVPPGTYDHLQGTKVKDFWINGIGWNWELLPHNLPTDIKHKMTALTVLENDDEPDNMSWSLTTSGRFSSSSALSIINPTINQVNLDIGVYRKLWKIHTTERARAFLWLALHGTIMTNEERCRRHLGVSNICPICGNFNESLLHRFRDCGDSKEVWDILVPGEMRADFYTDDFASWIRIQICCNTRIEDNVEWSAIFSLALWWLWKWRCEVVFTGKRKIKERVTFLIHQAKAYYVALQRKNMSSPPRVKEQQFILWKRPQEDWMKINTDASVNAQGLAAAAGVMRNCNGEWVVGFVHNIGYCSTPCAELWGILGGLRLAWEKGYRRICLETDSQLAVQLLNKSVDRSHPLASLVYQCRSFISRSWNIQLRHIFREANAVADCLASLAFYFPVGFFVLRFPPDDVITLIKNDVMGRTTPRLI